MAIFAVFLLFLTRRTSDGSLLTHPSDRNVTAGEHVILPCATNLDYPVYWYFNGHEIFYGGKVSMSFQSMFSVSSSKTGEYNLVISSADTSYNGLYACGDDEGQGERKSAHLYVAAATVTFAAPGGATDGGVNTGMIIGIVVIIALLLAILGAVCLYKKCVKKRDQRQRGKQYAEGQQFNGNGRTPSKEAEQRQPSDTGITTGSPSNVDTTSYPLASQIINKINKNDPLRPQVNESADVRGQGLQTSSQTGGPPEEQPLLGKCKDSADLNEFSDPPNRTRRPNVHDEEPCRGGNVTASNEDSLLVGDADHTDSYAFGAELNASNATSSDTKAAIEGSLVVVKDVGSSATVAEENELGKNILNESKVENQDTRESAAGSPGGGSGEQGTQSSTPPSSMSKPKDEPKPTVSPIQIGDESKHQGEKPIPAPKPGKPMT